jgi:aryl-alcohol dehydrogenase-like predicted oxidoreductase
MQPKSLPMRNLGKTGLKVSILGFGNWITGDKIEEE